MLSVSCPKCGGSNIFDETKQIPTFCAFCGSHLPDMTDFVKESLQLDIDKKRLDMELQKIDKQIKKDTSVDKMQIIKMIILLIVLLPLFIILLKVEFSIF